MMANSTPMKENDIGIIILGNAGAGKSFLCNLIIGEDRFAVDFQPDAVTTISQHHRLPGNPCDFLIYDIPGLIETDQERIDQNKKEINKVFGQCPKSFVLFVWRQTGGRAVTEDIIAFKALNKAYEFPSECLLHVLNNIPANRSSDYEAKFMLILSKQLKEIKISPENMFFLDNLDPTNEHKMQENRVKLFYFLRNTYPHDQKKDGEIILQSDEIETLTKSLKAQGEESDKELQASRGKLLGMMEELTDFIKTKAAESAELISYYCSAYSVGSAIAGAALGAAMGPAGAAIGGLTGALVGFLGEHIISRD